MLETSEMNLDAQWIVGFVDGEGCFHVGISKHSGMTTGFQVLPEFTVVQHERDIQVLFALKQYFGCGVVRKNHDARQCFRVRKLEDLREKIIPFFRKHPLKTRKSVDFHTFCRVVNLMTQNKHLTVEGMAHIRSLAETMNRRGSCSC